MQAKFQVLLFLLGKYKENSRHTDFYPHLKFTPPETKRHLTVPLISSLLPAAKQSSGLRDFSYRRRNSKYYFSLSLHSRKPSGHIKNTPFKNLLSNLNSKFLSFHFAKALPALFRLAKGLMQNSPARQIPLFYGSRRLCLRLPLTSPDSVF
jgi:hypothetical protein